MPPVRVIKCNSWEQFIQKARADESGRQGGGRYWRGHADPEWPLSSKFERWLLRWRGLMPERPVRSIFGPSGPESFEKGYLDRFKLAAVGSPTLDTSKLSIDDDWWVLGRHHGLITRLLDWTLSPYIAAFFAFTEFANLNMEGFGSGDSFVGAAEGGPGQVVIWALAGVDPVLKEFELVSRQQDNFYRQKAQAGIFTRLRHDEHLDLQSYLESRNLGHKLERLEISAGEIGKALNDLALMNITYSTLFPDADGAALEANVASTIATMAGGGIRVTIDT